MEVASCLDANPMSSSSRAANSSSPARRSPARVELSINLLRRAQEGDAHALDLLVTRYLPRVSRWATGRLPAWARDLADTRDLVQDTIIQAFTHIQRFEIRGEGALRAYLRRILLNRIRMEIRRAARRPQATTELEGVAADDLSPLEHAIGREAVRAYQLALGRLRRRERQLIVARVEMGYSNDEIAAAFGKRSTNAARMALQRALLRLADEMRQVLPLAPVPDHR